jgi:hypothetical protein
LCGFALFSFSSTTYLPPPTFQLSKFPTFQHLLLLQLIAKMGGLAGFLYRQSTFAPKPLPADISLSGKTALITGGNAGLGLEAAKEMAAHNLSRIILGVRTPSKGEAAKAEILAQLLNCDVLVWELDQESFPSIQAFAERAARELDRLDIVILCAGVKLLDFIKSKPTGHEMNILVCWVVETWQGG